MPNWVTHRIHLTGPTETLRTIKAAHIEVHPNDEDGDSVMGFSFQSLVPMPAVLEPVIASSLMELAVEAITGKSFGEVTQDPIKLHMEQLFRRPGDEAKIQARRDNLTVEQLEMGRLALKAIEETGHASWYDWNVAHWGTKWGAKGTRIFEETSTTLVIGFDTAWSVPEPIFAALAARYPDLLFEVDAFDEGWNFEAHGMGGAGVFTLTEGPATNEGHLRAYGELPEVEVMESPHDDTPHEEVPDPLGEGGILNIMITKFRITDEDSHE